MDYDFWQTLPIEFDARKYRSLYPDLAPMTDAELRTHYVNFGLEEGRIANGLRDRDDFAALIPKSATVLEIGPFQNPFLRGPNVSYFDVLSQEGLVARANQLGLDPSGVPHIDYVSPEGDLTIINNRRFDAVISSHCLEHQPDLVGHLQEVEKLLLPGGGYFIAVPDKRYCFDHFSPYSSLAEVIVAHHERRKVHTLRSLIEAWAQTTHNDPLRHWQGDHGIMAENFEQQRVQEAVKATDDANGKYIDMHAWYFSPDSLSAILSVLERTGLIQLGVQRIYPTRYGSFEFWMILRGCDVVTRERDTAVAERVALAAACDAVKRERDTAVAERVALAAACDAVKRERDTAVAERVALAAACDAVTRERNTAVAEGVALAAACDAVTRERDTAVAERVALAAASTRWFEATIAVTADHNPMTQARQRRDSWWANLGDRLIGKSRKPSSIVLANRARDAGNWELAIRYYRDALDVDPDDREIWMQCGQALKKAGKISEAEVVYQHGAR